jgi:hypothetical protein
MRSEKAYYGWTEKRLTQVSQKKRLGETSTVSAEIVRRYLG